MKPSLSVIHADYEPPPHRPLLHTLERAMAEGDLRDSLIAPIVLSALREEKNLEPARGFDPLWLIGGIRLSDEYYMRVRPTAGQRDWQRGYAQTVTPTLVGMAHSLQRSPDAQALVSRLCDSLASRLRLRLVWPEDPNERNEVRNAIYGACLDATELESDQVLVALKGLGVVGPE